MKFRAHFLFVLFASVVDARRGPWHCHAFSPYIISGIPHKGSYNPQIG